MSESDEDRQGEIKVTDKRMFTAEGELREEYRYLEQQRSGSNESEGSTGTQEAVEQPPSADEKQKTGAGQPTPPGGDLGIPGTRPRAAEPERSEPVASSTEPGTPLELPDTADSVGKPSFLDLLATLAEPATIYLGDVQLPDGKSAEDLRLARFYIDLLGVLLDKTQGSLSAQESSVLEDLIYRLQMRYVQKRG